MSYSSNKTSTVGNGLSAIGALGLGIYGIGQVHGYFNVFLFVTVSTLLLIITSKFMGSRKQKNGNIVYNPNEFFIISILVFIVLIGLYSCFSIYSKENELGEDITGYSILLVVLFVIVMPIFGLYSYVKNINDKIIIGNSTIIITDNLNSTEFKFEDIQSYQIQNSKLVLEIKETGNTSFDLRDLNLNSRDIKKLELDLFTSIKKIAV